MKFLIAGFGSIGRRHFRNLLTLGERDIVFLRSNRSTLSDEEILDFPVEKNLDAALAHNPDVVIISNPTALHLDIAIPAAEIGCHLFIEKPISHSLERIGELQTAVSTGGSIVFTAFQFRFHPGLALIQKMITDQQSLIANSPLPVTKDHSSANIGRPLSVRAHWGEYLPGWHPWEDYRQGYSARASLGGGVILTLCHPLDYLHWMLGDVDSLWAFTSQQSDLEIQVEDTAEIGLQFSIGVIGSVHLNYTQRPPSHHLEIVGTKGTIRWDNNDGIVHVFNTETNQWIAFPPPSGFARNDLFLAELIHFLQVLRGEVQNMCPLTDGITALQLAVFAQESAQTGKRIEFCSYPEQ
jgi:predicted dehydrogenase